MNNKVQQEKISYLRISFWEHVSQSIVIFMPSGLSKIDGGVLVEADIPQKFADLLCTITVFSLHTPTAFATFLLLNLKPQVHCNELAT